jgi:arsenate reductase
MPPVTIYHNPRCSKSRQALALLQEHGAEIEVIHYLETPPSADTLRSWLPLLGEQAGELVRKKEAREEGIDQLDGDALLEALVEHPRALQRPIVCVPGRAVVARPPEKVLELLT